MYDRLRLLERRDIDELIILDISATPNDRSPLFDLVRLFCDNLFCPVTIGGGIKSTQHARRLLAGGADKVSFGTAAVERPGLIDDASRKFGAQAVTVSIDVKGGTVWICCGRKDTGLDPVEWARECEERGAGEILLNSIEHDGLMAGYDLDLVGAISHAVSIPVIACGGCGDYDDMVGAMKAGAHAVAAGAMFQFREATPKGAARHLSQHGIATRL